MAIIPGPLFIIHPSKFVRNSLEHALFQILAQSFDTKEHNVDITSTMPKIANDHNDNFLQIISKCVVLTLNCFMLFVLQKEIDIKTKLSDFRDLFS